jgi:hypothetical protein
MSLKLRYNFDIKHSKKPLFIHKLYRHCTGFSERIATWYDSKKWPLENRRHVIWQSLADKNKQKSEIANNDKFEKRKLVMMPVIFKRFVGPKLLKNCSGHWV